MQMAHLMHEEFKDEHPEAHQRDSNARSAFAAGFTSYHSDSIDYLLEHHARIDVTLVLFYDQQSFDEKVMRELAYKLLEVLVLKFENKIQNTQF